MANLFDKCEVFFLQWQKLAGDQYDSLVHLREREIPTANCLPRVLVGDRQRLQLAAHDYLGLATHPETIKASWRVAGGWRRRPARGWGLVRGH